MTNLAVFKSRAQALDCVSYLRQAGIPSQTVSTPQAARAGCGISIKFDDVFLGRVRSLLAKRRYTSFAGYMRPSGGTYVYI